MKLSAPHKSPSITSSGSESAVNNTTEISFKCSSDLILSQSSNPFISGITISEITNNGLLLESQSNASSPFCLTTDEN